MSVYLRTAQPLHGERNMGNDLLISRVELTPSFDRHVCPPMFT